MNKHVTRVTRNKLTEVCLSAGEYVGKFECPACDSYIKLQKNGQCATCSKRNAAQRKADSTLTARRQAAEFKLELIRINAEYDLLEY